VAVISLGIIHAGHVRERGPMMARLMRDLRSMLPERCTHWRVHSEREAPREWARRAWHWAMSTGCNFHVILNDDVLIAPCFWGALEAMLEVLPKRTVLGLGTVSPGQSDAYHRGERWLRDGHGVVGWAYGMWTEEVQLLADEEAQLGAYHRSPGHDECKPECENWHEDSWVNSILEDGGIPVWHPIPSIVQHDVSLPSLYGNDHHKTRQAPITWDRFDLTSPAFWRP
jgi:hypothetical protein